MYLLFDFDGTLVDSFDCVMKKAMLLADEFSFRKIYPHEVDGLRDMSSTEIIKFFNISMYKIPTLISQMKKHLHQEMSTLMPVTGIQRILEDLNNAQFTLGILTSNSVENVEKWLNINKMRHLFSFIHSESNYFSKKYLIKKTLKQYKIAQSHAIYIGDETRDIDAAKKNNIGSIAVTWGYNSEKAILAYQPSYVARIPEDILTFSFEVRDKSLTGI